jgi:hypothetical protein
MPHNGWPLCPDSGARLTGAAGWGERARERTLVCVWGQLWEEGGERREAFDPGPKCIPSQAAIDSCPQHLHYSTTAANLKTLGPQLVEKNKRTMDTLRRWQQLFALLENQQKVCQRSRWQHKIWCDDGTRTTTFCAPAVSSIDWWMESADIWSTLLKML